MPKLKKKSNEQRRALAKSLMSRRREEDSTKDVVRKIDRRSKAIRRQESSVRQHHNIVNKACQKKRLEDAGSRGVHRQRLSENQTKRLTILEKKNIHRQRLIDSQARRLMIKENKSVHLKRLKECQNKRLMINENKSIHLKRLKECQNKRLMINENREAHREIDRKAHKRRLMDIKSRNVQREREKNCQKRRLSVKGNRKIHQLRLIACQRKRLMIKENCKQHRQRLIECQRKRLMIKENCKKHRERLIRSQRKRLMIQANRHIHRQRLIVCQKRRLRIDANRQIHQQRDKNAHKRRLKNKEKRDVHLSRLRESQKRKLKNISFKTKHKLINQMCQKKRQNNFKWRQNHRLSLRRIQHKKLSNMANRNKHNRKNKESYQRRITRRQNDIRIKLFYKYNTAVKDGPYWECVSCCRLMFRSSVTYCTMDMLKNIPLPFLKQCCSKMMTDNIVGYLCSACRKCISRKEKPRFSLCHEALRFPEILNEVKKLTPLEERFLCPRIPFMQIRTFGGNQQYSVKGRVVNVPTDVAENIEVLPRLPHETDIIPVVLKKKKQHKSNVMFQSVRPYVILEALKALENCTVYKKADVKIDYSKINDLNKMQTECDTSDNENDVENGIAENVESDSDSESEPLNVPSDHTLLNSEAIIFAPGENFQPIPLFMDTDAEAMSFIKIYGGEIKQYPSHMSYQEITKSEVMRSDRRVASSIDKLFFSCTYLRAQKISNSISICMRKSSGRHNSTVANVLADDFIKSITVHDSGYKVFAPDRGSPAFWEQKKKELFAMIRQLGPPTFFLTLSPAETKWPELLVILKKVVDGIDITEEDALNMKYEEKVRLIKDDPVTCSVYFDYRLRKLFNVLKAKDSVFREFELVDSYTRIEFQQRGSPHAHSLIWLKDSPRLNQGDLESLKQCELFIDRFVTCKHDSIEVTPELVQFQQHKHTFTCWKKKDEKKCRFGIPSYPMKKTKILEPLDDSINQVELKKHKGNLVKIRHLLDQMYQREEDITTVEFLERLMLTEDEYLMAIRSSLKRPKCFLKRSVKDIRVNAYNPEILSLHRSNMDIQFITDVYSCAMYVLNYINKSKGGISKIMRDAMKEVKKGDFTIKEKLRFLANKFLNASEFSAQEAVYYILSLSLSICSRSTVFINTSPPEKRVSILKSKRDLLLLPETSTNIYKKGMIDHYTERPDELSNVCLAEFAAYYTYSSSKSMRRVDDFDYEYDDDMFNESDAIENKIRMSTGVFIKRRKAKILRYVRYNVETDELNYFREQLMLFLPWRNEKSDIININHKKTFADNQDIILTNRSKFIYGDTGEDLPLDDIELAVNNYNLTDESSEEDNSDSGGHNEFEVLNDRGSEADIFNDTGINVNKKTTDDVTFPVPHLIDDNYYQLIVRTLNRHQKQYLLHILNCHKIKKIPLYECVLGGAGVGKSRLIEAIHQTLLRYYNSQEGSNLESLKVLICAPTGKAAYNIKGITLHSAFVLPLNQFGFEMPPLSSSMSNTILSKLHDLKLIIMDEISMVGSKVLGQINLRLQQIFRSSEPFAGKSIIMFGDFNQLAPVGDRYIFKPDPSNSYGDLVGNPLWEKFSFYALTEIMRQKDDAKFATALNHLAEGTLTEEEIEMFNTRTNCSEPPETIRLFRSNAEVDRFNESVLNNQNNVIVVQATDKVIGKVPETVKNSLIKTVKDLNVSSTYGLPKTLKLSIGIHYMLTNNIKVQDGLVNGAVGILRYIEKNDCGDVKRLWMLFDDPHVGKETRNTMRHISIAKCIDESLTPIELLIRNIKPRKNTIAMVMRKQFPVVPAEAITIYKSQGGTYSTAVVNIRSGMKRNELYVAFSRVTSLRGLFIRGNFIKPQKSSDEVTRVIKDALKEKPVNMKLNFLEKDTTNFTIVFHNVQSLRKHHADLVADYFLTSASVIALVETWTLSTDNVEINGYEEVYRVDVQQDYRHAYGMLVYCKTDIANSVEVLFEYNCEQTKKSCNIVVLKIKGISICVTYKPPSTSFSEVKNQIKNMLDVALDTTSKVVVLGDYNIDLMGKSAKMFETFLTLNGLSNKIEKQPSTNGMTQIDICFSNMFELSASYFESYYSYHKPIICVVNEDINSSFQNIHISSDNGTSTLICTPVSTISPEKNSSLPRKTKATDINRNVEAELESHHIPNGFHNVDGVSCYANVVCQCIMFIVPLHNAIVIGTNNPLTKLAEIYFSPPKQTLSSWEIRQFIDKENNIEQFTLREQQDVPEFINYLSNCLPTFEVVLLHLLCYEFKCTHCFHSYRDTNEVKNKILPIYTREGLTSLKTLYEKSYGNWETVERACNQCSSVNSMVTRTLVQLEDQCSIIIFQLMIFEYNGSEIIKKKQVLQNLNEEIISINGFDFKVSGIIYHHGTSISSGHYTCKLRSLDSWIHADDQTVIKCKNPSFETDVYAIILEKS